MTTSCAINRKVVCGRWPDSDQRLVAADPVISVISSVRTRFSLNPDPDRKIIYPHPVSTRPDIAQLTIYALALTQLVPGLKLFDIKCVWFNEEEYCEFFSRLALASKK